MKSLFSFLLLLLARIPLIAQEIDAVNYNMQHYSDENGLPQNSVKSIAKDENGFLWLTTEDGLVRFDGRLFKNFNKSNLATSSNRFSFLAPGWDDGNLYAQNSEDQFFLVRNGKVFPSPERTRQFKKQQINITSTYWSQGLWDTDRHYLDLNLFRSIIIPTKAHEYYESFHNRVVFHSSSKTKKTISNPINDFWGLFTLDRQMYYRDSTGILLRFDGEKSNAVSLTGDILKHKNPNGTTTPIKILWNINVPENICFKVGRSIYLAKKGPNANIETRLLLNGFDFDKNQIDAILFDEQTETIWLGSKNNGLFRFSKKQFLTLNSGDKIKNDEVYYAQTPYDSLSVLLPRGLVLGINKNGTVLAKKVIDPSPRQYTILTDLEGFIWREANNVVFKMDHQFRILGQWKIPYELIHLLEGSDGWIYAAFRDEGLARIRKTDTSGHFEFVEKTIKNITYLAQQSDDVLLIGTSDGLSEYNLKTHIRTQFKSLTGKFVRSIYCPKPFNKAWITTYGDGFYLLENEKLTQFPLDRNKYLAASHCIIEDSKGYFWITTNKGLFQVSKEDLLLYASNKVSNLYYAYFSRENGFGSNEFNGGCQPCAVKLEGGTISLPSMNGLVFFKPGEFSTEFPNHKIFIDEIDADNVALPKEKTIELKHNFSLLSIQVSTPYYGNARNVQLEYSIGEDTSKMVWFPVNDNGVISISNLRSGKHVLSVRKFSGFGVNQFDLKTIQLYVLPAWYETWWFRAVSVFCASLLVILYVRRRTKILSNRNKLLETRINERTQTLQTTLATLQSSQDELLRQMFLYERLVGSISHDIRTPLTFLARSGQHLLKQLERHAPNPELLEIGKANWEFSERLLHLTNNLLDFIKSWLTKDKVEMESVDLNELVTEKMDIFLAVARDKKTEIVNEVNPSLIVESHPGMVSVIVYNLLDNALKATKKGSIVVSDQVLDDRVRILIKDSGRGMDIETIRWINQPTTDAEITFNRLEMPKRSGLGLTLATELAAAIGIQLFAEINETGGTTMHIIFPMP